MATSKPSKWTFLASAPDLKGLLESFGATGLATAESFVSFGAKEKEIRICRATGDEDNPHEDVPIAGATITIALGPLDMEPTAGFSNGRYNAITTGLTNVPAAATALQMQTALNAHPTITAQGGVAVTKGKTGYRVEWNLVGGPRNLLEWFSGSLTPAAKVSVEDVVVGDATKREVKLVKISQNYWAFQDDWLETANGAVAYAEITPGADGVVETSQITITGVPTSGQFRVTAPQSAVHAITAVNNSAGTKATYRFNLGSNSIVSGDYVDLMDAAGPVRVWFNIAGAGPAPAVPAGGRLKAIVSPDTLLANLGPNFWSAFFVDSGLEQAGTTYGYSYIDIRTKVAGYYPEPVTPGFTDFQFFNGSAGGLDGVFFSIYDAAGQVGVWIDCTGTTEIPILVTTMTRSIRVTGIGAAATANAVATAIQLALDADAEFTATVVGNRVTVTDAKGGPRALPTSGASGIGIAQTKPGYNISGTLPYSATAAQMRDLLQSYYDVTKTTTDEVITFALTATSAGAMQALVVADIDLAFSRQHTGIFTLNTATMLAAFEATAEDVLVGILQGQYQFAGEDPVVFYYSPCTVYRSLIDSGGIDPNSWLGTPVAKGTVALANGVSQVNVVFGAPLGSTNYTILAGYIENAVDPSPDNLFCGTVVNKTVNGYTQYISGLTSSANYVYRYAAKDLG